MKKKKSLLSLGLITLVLILGVGYAVVSNVGLTISGKVSENSDLKVSFKSADDGDNEKITATTTDGSLTATINVQNLSSVGDKVTATYVIQNKEKDVDAKVVEKEIKILAEDGTTDLSEYFSVTTDIDGSTGLEVAHEGTATVEVTVELLKTPLTNNDSTANVTIELDASAVVPAN